VWDAATGERVVDLDAGSHNGLSGAAASPAGPIVAIARDDGQLTMFDLAARKKKDVALGEPSHACAFSPDGALVAALGGRERAEATVVATASGEVVRTVGRRTDAAPEPDGALAFSPDGKLLAVVARDRGDVRLYDVATGALASTISVAPAASIAFAPDGARLAVGLRSGQVLLHDLRPPR
jgi:WD40 repeat protein